MDLALDIVGLLALLERGERVLVPNDRAAGQLRQSFDAQQRNRGLHAWESATVSTWKAWTESLWSAVLLSGRDDRMLLNRLQEDRLWADILAASPEGAPVPRTALPGLAQAARSAFALAASFEALDRVARFADSFDSRAFAGWSKSFVAHCERARFLPAALLEAALLDQVGLDSAVWPKSLSMAGFEDLSAAQTSLLNRLGELGCEVTTAALRRAHETPPQLTLMALPNPEDELRWALRSIRQRFETASATSLNFALILPSPDTERSALEPLLREILAPELEAVDADLSSTPWHFSKGSPLAQQPVVRDALTLLRWLREDLRVDAAGRLLLSPYFQHSDELEARTRFEMRDLRRAPLLRPELTLGNFVKLRQHASAPEGSRVALREFVAVYELAGGSKALTGQGSYADWTDLIRKLLSAAGWPGPRTQTAAEFSVTEAWEGLLDLIATLDFRGQRPGFGEVLALLEQEAAATPAPSPAGGAPIQILTSDEVEGCCFDAVLLLRATDEHLPRPEHIHPLLGWSLQRSLGMPGIDAARAHTRARSTLVQLGERCGELLFSHAHADETGDLRPTRLAAELGLAYGTVDDPSSTAGDLPLELESIIDTDPLPALPSPRVHGGARVLELQAACGFRAFAALRLQVGELEDARLGLQAREGGKVLHEAMAAFWEELGSQAALRALSMEQRQRTVARCVRDGMAGLRARVTEEDVWVKAYLEVSERRLCNLVERWLELELQRGAFTVLSPEQDQEVTIGSLEFKVRPDRIDRVEGGFVYVDYKTSFDLSTVDWLGERPTAPQLPLYALLGEADEVRGLAFARMRSGEDMTWLSLQDREDLFPGKKGKAVHDLSIQIELWHQELTRLAEDFASGQAFIDPKTFPGSCKFCTHRLLCRIDERSSLARSLHQDSSPAQEHIFG